MQPPLENFHEYFKNLSKSSRLLDIPSLSTEDSHLDYDITLKELEDACSRLLAGKACGFDDICNEMIISLNNTHPKIILKLFNNLLQSGEVIQDWVIGLIVPIHKEGPKLDTSNYRGITLISCLGKLFLSILNDTG